METERIWMCEVCEQAPVAFTCKADAAALCVACDADIHSANHLARRHHRVPVVDPFLNASNCQQEDVIGSWLLPKLISETNQVSDMDPFIDFEYQNSFHLQRQAMDSVVPVQIRPATNIPVLSNEIENSFHVDFSPHNLPTFSCRSQSVSHSVSSSSSLEVGVVSDGKFLSDISYPLGGAMTMIDPSIAISAETSRGQGTQSGVMNREARVLRYREKRKNRKYEKTVRYASRKAYAETRPRIKGRFVKRTQVEHHMYNNSAVAAALPSTRTTASSSRILMTDDVQLCIRRGE